MRYGPTVQDYTGVVMGTYDRQIAKAKDTIAKKGRKCVWAVLDQAAPADADKPWKPGAPITDKYDVDIVFLPETRVNTAFLQMLTGTSIVEGSDYGLMAAVKGFVPTTRAEVYAEDGTTLLRGIKSVDVLAPDGVPILYTIRFTVAP